MHKTKLRSNRSATRREFLKGASGAAAAAGAAWLLPASVFGDDAPSHRIHVALIGCGNQSRVDLPAILRHDDVQVVAVCDVNRGSHGYARPEHFLGREPARQKVDEHYAAKKRSGSYSACDAYADFREVLARKDVDAVWIVLPDHWHALAACMAARAGKDVYCQKPLTLTVHDGQEMIKVVRQHQRILQTGSQYRSSGSVRHACELVRNGRIGQVQRVISIVSGAGAGPGPGWTAHARARGFRLRPVVGPRPRGSLSQRPLSVPVSFHSGLLRRPGDQHGGSCERYRSMGSRNR